MAIKTTSKFAEMKQKKEKIVVLTAYDYMWGSLLSQAGVDVILVGDSLGQVVLGYDNTLPVTIDDMIRHTAAVSRGACGTFLMADLPFNTMILSEDKIVEHAGRLLSEGHASAVKIEGGRHIAPVIKRMVSVGIPVCAHIGITPQAVHIQGYKTQGVTEFARQRLLEDAAAVTEAGAFAIVLEKIEKGLAAEVTEKIPIPTIGIGSGVNCDGQVLVIHDILGLFDKFVPPFVKKYNDLREPIVKSISEYAEDVRAMKFPE